MILSHLCQNELASLLTRKCPSLVTQILLENNRDLWLEGSHSTLVLSVLVGPLHTESRDEDVYDHNDEDDARSNVLQHVQFEVLALVIQVPLHDEDEQDPHDDLQDDAKADEGDHGSVEGEIGALLQHGLQLRRIGHEQGNVQHAFRSTLLVGIVVHVQRARTPPPSALSRDLNTGTFITLST